jgi:DNA replication protein DnaC
MYQIKEHSDYFNNADADTKKRFDMVKKLSKNFTVVNEMALQIDKLLMELKGVDAQPMPANNLVTANFLTSQSTTKKENQKPQQKVSLTESFEDLFQILKEQSIPVQPEFILNKETLKETLHETLKEVKIRYSDLDNDVQKRFSTLPITLQYELPERTLPAFAKPPISEFQQMVDDLVMGNNVFLVGGAGTGKTFTAENLLSKSALGRPHITINCSQWTSPTEIIGGQTMDGYVEGKLIEAWKNGWVLILDELPKMDANTAGLFNDALSKTKLDKATIFNARKEAFEKHPDFACIATGNVYPDKENMKYNANNKQDLSLLDRFSGSVYFVEKNPEIERMIVQNDMLWSICDKTRSVIEELKYDAQLSLRFMQTARDAYQLEMLRLNSKKPNGIQANEGKTFKSAMDSYLSTFTEIQKTNIKTKIRYSELFNNYEYRRMDTTLTVY